VDGSNEFSFWVVFGIRISRPAGFSEPVLARGIQMARGKLQVDARCRDSIHYLPPHWGTPIGGLLRRKLLNTRA
jgi:hypothetical protein